MKKKLLAIVALIAIVFVASVFWRVDSFVFEDRMNWAEAQARSQMVSVHHTILVEMKALERVVSTFNSENFNKEKINWSALQPYYAIASLNLNSQKEIQVQNFFTKEKSPASAWTVDYLSKAIGSLNKLKPSNSTQIFVKPFVGNNKEKNVAILLINNSKIYAIVGAGEIFQSLVDSQRGSLNSFSIVSTSGLTVGHNIPEYVGTTLSDDIIFKAAKESGVSQGVGVFESSDGQKVFGIYNQIANTNLIILSSASYKDIMKGRNSLLWQFTLLGFGLILVGVAGLLLVILPHEKSLEQLRLHMLSLMSGKKDFRAVNLTPEIAELDGLLNSLPTPTLMPQAMTHKTQNSGKVSSTNQSQASVNDSSAVLKTKLPEQSAVAVSAVQIQEEKMEAYRKVASALGHEMRAPLSSILGYSQLVLAKTQDPEITNSIESILRESRGARVVLEKLFSFAGEEELTKNDMRLDTVVLRTLTKMNALFVSKGVKVEKELIETSYIPVCLDELVRALENILTNSVEAMERMSQKLVSIKLFEDAEGIHLDVSDTGEGIEPHVVTQVFDPFFTTRSFQNHMGMGLAVVVGILKEHGATIQVTSKRGQGTQMSILFAKKIEKVIAAPRNLSSALNMVLPETLPEAPPAALAEAQEQAIADLKANKHEYDLNDSRKELSPPGDVNIDSLLELPPMNLEKESPEGLNIHSGFSEKTSSQNLNNLEFIQNDSDLDATVVLKVDAEIMENKVAAPKTPPPAPKASKLDNYQVEIRKPGKR